GDGPLGARGDRRGQPGGGEAGALHDRPAPARRPAAARGLRREDPRRARFPREPRRARGDRRERAPLAEGPPGRVREPLLSRGRPTPIPNPLLSVVMPVYNEQGTLEEIIGRVLAVPLRIELITVDDASTDQSRAILERLSREKGFKLFGQEKNRGKGAA